MTISKDENVYSDAEIRPYSKKKLAELYTVSPKCFSTMLAPYKDEIGTKSGWYFNINQVTTIFNRLGKPKSIKKSESL